MPDLVELGLHCDDELVGVCQFDLTKYIDKGARVEKVCMLAPEETPSNPQQIVLKGNAEEHPDAHLIFRIFVDSIQTQPGAGAKGKDASKKAGAQANAGKQ